MAICDTGFVPGVDEMGLEDRKSGFPHARGSLHPLLLTHDVFATGTSLCSDLPQSLHFAAPPSQLGALDFLPQLSVDSAESSRLDGKVPPVQN